MDGWVCRDDDGLLLEPRGASLGRRPSFAVEAAQERVLRFCVDGSPVLWAKIDDHWEDVAFLSACPEETLSIVHPITMTKVRSIDGDQGHPSWWAAWSRWFAEALIESRRSPLYASRWRLDPPAAVQRRELPAAHSAASALVTTPCRFELGALRSECIGGLLTLRQRSASSCGRVISWRKRARDGVCPPVLVLYVQALGKHVLLDGHDRLQACVLEGIEAPYIVLWPERLRPTRYREADVRSIAEAADRILGEQESPSAGLVAGVNAWVMTAFTPWTSETRTRAFSLEGGHAAWEVEVRRRLAELDGEVDAEAVSALLEVWR